MTLLAHNQTKLDKYIEEFGLKHIHDYLHRTTKQGIRSIKAGKTDYTKTCCSRIGGDPDLPPQIEWPLTEDGTPMTFLAQLNLSELTASDDNNYLPKTGILAFFLGIDEPAYNIEHKVLFINEAEMSAAVRREAPEETALEDSFEGYAIKARSSLEPPNYVYADYDLIEGDEEADVTFDDYEEFTDALQESEQGEYDVFQMFGYPAGQHGDAEYEAALMILAGKEYDYNSNHALRNIIAALGGDQVKAEQEIADMLLLLELGSDNDIGFCWWDAGALQFYIRKEDLLAARFDRTYCSLYSS
ncbi:YwqG family protein [Paenibacillus sp. GXUN7292]|uniref:YwqG family protein n=1 Tax=Paenibacillus sp. GXUN7292 TaxID=3422499 RepID=UPI003D7EC579